MHRRVDWPCLKAKAANAAMVCDWIADIAIAVAEHEPNERNRARAVMLWGFKELWRIFRLGHWLTEEEAAAVEKARMCALLGDHACSRLAPIPVGMQSPCDPPWGRDNPARPSS